ncbi:BTAD domain-containing putative transcriptional regulator [Rhodovulum sp. DZ06]|uniref:AfsR/SARP family transcriptional regulator n=1 Tax=Rhodovulum sp. DZ06 TaxID=3425126 RepID=UPI003D34FFD5
MGAALVRGPDGISISTLGAKSVAMLAFVALQPGQAASRDALVELLWPRSDAEQGRASLRQELRRMKKAMGPVFEAALDTPSGQVALRPGRVFIDAAALEEAAESRDSAGLAAVPTLYGGPFLAPLAVAETPFQDWQAETNSRLEEVTVEALLRLMLLDEAAGRLDRAATAARTLLGIDPFQEDVHASLIRIHAAAGRIGAARQQLERCRKLFMEELDEDPGPQLAALIPDARGRRAAAQSGAKTPVRPTAPLPGRPTPVHAGPRRALAALSVRAADKGDPEMSALAAQVAASIMNQLGPGCWLGVALPDALRAAGEDTGGLLDRATCVADVALSRAGDRLRADLSVLGRPDGAVRRAETIEAAQDDELAPAVALARRAAAALGAAFMDAAEAEAELEGNAAGADGWSALMRANRLMRESDPAALTEAHALLESLVRAEPDFTEALCLASVAHMAEIRLGLSDAPRESMFRARELALRAVKRRPDAAWPHYALGLATSLAEDPLAAQSQHLHALRLAPGFAPAMGEVARGLALAGDRAEAELWAARALESGPSDPCTADWLHARAAARFAGGDHAGAAAAAAEAEAARPGWVPAQALLAAALRAGGDGAGADRAASRAASAPRPFSAAALEALHPFADRALTDALIAELPRG